MCARLHSWAGGNGKQYIAELLGSKFALQFASRPEKISSKGPPFCFSLFQSEAGLFLRFRIVLKLSGQVVKCLAASKAKPKEYSASSCEVVSFSDSGEETFFASLPSTLLESQDIFLLVEINCKCTQTERNIAGFVLKQDENSINTTLSTWLEAYGLPYCLSSCIPTLRLSCICST